MSSLVLGIDTATDVRVGLAADGAVVASAAVADTRAHAEQLMLLVQQVLAEAGHAVNDLTEVVVGIGPGPFTGLRVGVAAGHTLAAALGLPVRGVCSLDVVAAEWARRGDAPAEFLIASDARRKEVYWARYDRTGRRVDGPAVSAPTELPALPLGGPGAHLVADEVAGPDTINAGLLAALDLPDAGLEPLYLRRPDAEVPTRLKSTLLQPRLAVNRTK
ncbi:tRNA threonylcarbamoyl adenosine modification protein YeaZ [Propionicimonas paludicola]|uniref:tRNA threonylcarbamoyl adenosine modification protein YeaZ n=1 Tax=Propionicimonas paludicola TaxID=185243 RepID=A0A2A9CTR8_9ACTN|nr:tRNA (adenosine(37)-N6)-threonylcarbamoyltransferase complex dimerization subunit type 1 TsaB [Propionicimonas paludicola]PFG17506.1 tRNA threonylcarbamoyl adenosine modification protein YeaZ [Propionicimonas paludicola]